MDKSKDRHCCSHRYVAVRRDGYCRSEPGARTSRLSLAGTQLAQRHAGSVAAPGRIVPTKFPHGTSSVGQNDKVVGLGYSLESILLQAYGQASSARMISTVKLPEDKFDFIANLPQN